MASLIKKLTQGTIEIEIAFKGKAADDPLHNISIEDVYVHPPVKESFPLYRHDEPVRGKITITTSKRVDHKGIDVEFTGHMHQTSDRDERLEFVRQNKRLAEEGRLEKGACTFEFDFDSPKLYESYRGFNAMVMYFVRVNIARSIMPVSKKQEIWVHLVDPKLVAANVETSPLPVWAKQEVFGPESVSMEVGVEDKLHIEFKYNQRVFHLRERVLGMVSFKDVKLALLFGEVSIVKREYLGGPYADYETETLQKYEIMDGTPIPGEVVPIRLYLASIPRLTPTYVNMHDRITVKYYLNLVLVTADGKRYFKQQEITLYRLPGQQMAPPPSDAA